MASAPEKPLDESHTYLRTEFLERIAHELRGPAGVTRGALDEIERALGPKAAEVKPFFAMARRGIGRILRSADRLQRTAQFELHRESGPRVPADLRRIAAEAAREAEEIESRRNIRVAVAAGDQPCFVAVDASWLSAALAEIVGNAIRFAQASVSVETAIADSEARVTILDDGPGFAGPPPQRFRAPYPRRGLGLSLPLVSDILEAHSGKLLFQDLKAEGHEAGTRVIVALKLHVPLEDEGRV
jgi:signal transduction histidine kinase